MAQFLEFDDCMVDAAQVDAIMKVDGAVEIMLASGDSAFTEADFSDVCDQWFAAMTEDPDDEGKE